MKIDRLLSIITILLQQDKATAPELARKLEVSRRTIQRDIEDICKAGIPVVTFQGGDGGISIAEGFKLDKRVLSVDELQNILVGLKSIASVSSDAKINRLITKLAPENASVALASDSIHIDLSSHYKSTLTEKISLIKSAISDKHEITFDYYSEKGMTSRRIEPYFINYRWTSWYVFGFCKIRNDFRMFKLNRLWNLNITNETFIPREAPREALEKECFTDEHKVTVLFDPSAEYLLIEEYGPDCYVRKEDGQLEFSAGFSNRDYAIRWILGFGGKAKVIDPPDIAKEIKENAKKIIHNYEHDI